MSFIGKGLLTRAKMTQTVVPSKPTAVYVTALKSWSLEYTAQPVSSSMRVSHLNWSKPLPGGSTGFCFFQTADLGLLWSWFL